MTDSPSSHRFMIYGANGYTGELCAREAARRGLAPILAGRNGEAVAELAGELGLEHRVFSLDEEAVNDSLEGVAAVLHCAGPFVRTSKPMASACLATGTHYLDITGEMAVFEALHRITDKARAAGVALLPGVGFDVVPTDCLAARLAAALPEATHLELAFAGDGAEWSRGTLNTMIESLPHMGAVRLNGQITPVPPAYESRKIEFPGLGRRNVTTIPWGDVSTAYHSTGIPNIKVYTAMPPSATARLKRIRPFLRLAGFTPIKRALQAWVRRRVTGPDAAVRDSARMYVWGQVRDGAGRVETGALSTPEGYTLTAVAGVEAARRAAAGDVEPGTWTPSTAFGADFVTTLDDVETYL